MHHINVIFPSHYGNPLRIKQSESLLSWTSAVSFSYTHVFVLFYFNHYFNIFLSIDFFSFSVEASESNNITLHVSSFLISWTRVYALTEVRRWCTYSWRRRAVCHVPFGGCRVEANSWLSLTGVCVHSFFRCLLLINLNLRVPLPECQWLKWVWKVNLTSCEIFGKWWMKL